MFVCVSVCLCAFCLSLRLSLSSRLSLSLHLWGKIESWFRRPGAGFGLKRRANSIQVPAPCQENLRRSCKGPFRGFGLRAPLLKADRPSRWHVAQLGAPTLVPGRGDFAACPCQSRGRAGGALSGALQLGPTRVHMCLESYHVNDWSRRACLVCACGLDVKIIWWLSPCLLMRTLCFQDDWQLA